VSLTDETLWRATHRMEAAASQMERAADRMEQAAQRIAHLLEDGYGGNGLRLIELLENAQTETKG
jgi:hypothetical protein